MDRLRRARQMWSGPFPDLFTPDGRVRGRERSLLAFLIGWVVICLLILAVLLLSSCSAEYMREKPIVTDLHKYCLEYPKDSACQGKESK